jgi:hypothetical protein
MGLRTTAHNMVQSPNWLHVRIFKSKNKKLKNHANFSYTFNTLA